MPKTLKNGRLVIRTYKNSIRLTEDQARFVEKTLFDDLPYTIEDDDDNPEPPTEKGLKDDPEIMSAFKKQREGRRSE